MSSVKMVEQLSGEKMDMKDKKREFKVKPRSCQMMEEIEREQSELQQGEIKTRKAPKRKELEDLVKEKDEIERRYKAEKDCLMLQLEEERRNIENERERFELQCRESKTRETQIREEMEDLLNEKNEIEKILQADMPSLLLLLKEKRMNIEKKKMRYELQLKDIEAREPQMRKEMEDLVNEKNERKRLLQANKDSLVLQLEKMTRTMQTKKQWYEPQLRRTETKEALMRKEMGDLVMEIGEIKSKFQVDKDSLVLKLEGETRNIQKAKETYDLQQIEFKTREAQMREEIETLMKEMDKMCNTFQAEKDSLVFQLEKEGKSMEKEGSELQRREIEARKAQMREDMEILLKDRDELWETFQASTDRLVVQLEKKTSKLMKEKERSELQHKETEAREAQMRDEMKALRDEIRQVQAYRHSSGLQLEKEKDQCQEIERSEELNRSAWINHCKSILEKEKMLDELTVEMEVLKGTLENLRKKTTDMDTKMMEVFNEVDQRLKNFIPQWFQKLWEKKKKKKIRQDLEKEIMILVLQLRVIKVNIALVNERLKI
ncbi:uncharacterized protein Hap1MRO34_016777 [Clarias gariepinus]|uniref:myosin heavy chain, clone 203-like n=1 Tax=Clarias gariepinus TaxID=13013 RepID=UPI00234C2817|nr:myosin heavy chain, clone 203-like [Clarias gariepinus]